MDRSSEEKTLAGLAHIAAIFSWFWIGIIVNVVLLVVYREKSKFVFDHAKQALALSAINVVLGLILGVFLGGSLVLSIASLGAAAGTVMLVGALGIAKLIAILIFAILGAVKGFGGQEHRYPLFGETVQKIGEKAA